MGWETCSLLVLHCIHSIYIPTFLKTSHFYKDSLVLHHLFLICSRGQEPQDFLEIWLLSLLFRVFTHFSLPSIIVFKPSHIVYLFFYFLFFCSQPCLSKNKPCGDALNQQLSVWTGSFFQEYECWIISLLNHIHTWLCCMLCSAFVPTWLCWS